MLLPKVFPFFFKDADMVAFVYVIDDHLVLWEKICVNGQMI
jgi:hypothetical protein